MVTTHRRTSATTRATPAGLAASWTVVAESLANPGQGAGAASASGVRINEMSDAADFTKEFIELYYDSHAATPDDGPSRRGERSRRDAALGRDRQADAGPPRATMALSAPPPPTTSAAARHGS